MKYDFNDSNGPDAQVSGYAWVYENAKVYKGDIVNDPLKDTKEPSQEKFEFIVNVEWFYDIMPTNKHRKEESVFASNHSEAAVMVERKYPNATILSSKSLI